VLGAVRKAEELIVADKTLNKEYLAIAGHQPFIETAQNLTFGEKNPAVVAGKVASVQALSGTGALRLAFEWFRE